MQESSQAARLPSLRSGLWLYVAVFLATEALTNALRANFELSFLRLITAVFFAFGFTLLAAQITRKELIAAYGRQPFALPLLASVAIGVAGWLPASWLTFVANYLLDTIFGPRGIPQSITRSENVAGVVVSLGLLVPFCYGALFFAFIHSSGRALGKVTSAFLTAILYGFFALVSTDFGFSGITGALLIGALAAVMVNVMESAWYGIAITIGYSIVRPLTEGTRFESELFAYLTEDISLFNIRWLFAIAVTLFAAFAILQLVRVLRTAPPQPQPAPRLGRWWQAPLIVILIGVFLMSYAEFDHRAQIGALLQPPPDTSRSTVPPTGP